MKYLRPLLGISLLAVTLSLFIFADMVSAAPSPTHRCTSHWRVAASATIHNAVDNSNIGTVSLLRDGCGDIQAKLHPLITTTSMYVYLTNAKNVTIGVEATGTGNTTITTAIFPHYKGVAVSATGTIVQVTGDGPTISVAQTANNSGH